VLRNFKISDWKNQCVCVCVCVCVLICLHSQKMWTVTVMITEVVNKYSSNNSTTASTQTVVDSL